MNIMTTNNKSVKKRGRPRDARLHAHILKSTADLTRELGYNKTTMEKIAQRTGVSRATLYRWWDGKGQLVIEALMAQRKHPPRAITDDFEAGLEELVTSMVDSLVSPHNLDAIIGLEYDSRYDKKLEKNLRESRVETTDIIREVFIGAKTSGKIPLDCDEDTVYHLLYGGTIALANHHRSMSGKQIKRKILTFFRMAFGLA